MNKLRIMMAGLLFAAITATGGIAAAATTSQLLQQGLYAEEVEGNIEAAIKTYGQVIKTGSAPANHVAQAMYRQGMCYLKIKDEASARAVLEKLVADYPGQTEIVEKARPVLDDLTNFDPATLMPPGTLVYAEFGSPGRQIETILSLLKGTPYENPLAAIGGPPAGNPGQKSPGDIMAALLNPSMMAEFKKIRGSAIGVTGLAQDNPPLVSVLYPGKSDALRGLILAGLGMIGTPGEPIEGMQTLTIPPAGAAAYDEKVVIVAQPASQLTWCIRQYKGLISEPTLASHNKSFAKLNKSMRQRNALTLWANVDDAYAQLLRMFPAGGVPQEILAANAICDFTNIDEIVFTESIESNGLGSRADVQLKEGHRCLAFDLIRTPNINKAALEAVPSGAIAMASFSLGQPNTAQAEKVRTKIQNVTGLDVGREIFANIEQVTLFALPLEGDTIAASPEVLPGRLGLAITSRNPDQTRQILDTLLGTMSAGRKNPQPGQYRVGGNEKQEVYCYVEQLNGITLLSLNRDIINASTAAIRNHKSVCAAGPLNKAVNKLSPAASKLLLVNVGGAMRLVGPQVDKGALNEEQLRQLNESYAQLARAADSALVELRTDEGLNNLSLNSGLTGIPPLNEIIGPATQIARISNQARTEAAARQSRKSMPAVVSPAATAPVIDGKLDDVWAAAPSYPLSHATYVRIESPEDLTADFKAAWDRDNLYVLVTVADDFLKSDSGADWWQDDSVEIYIDADNSKAGQYGEDDSQYTIAWDNGRPKLNRTHGGRTENVEVASTRTDKGYCVEVKFPWATLGRKPSPGARIGLDVQVNDDDDGGSRDSKLAWHDEHDVAWQNPQAFGNAELAGLVGWWKLDESDGKVAADSSGNGNNGSLQGNPAWRPRAGKVGGAIELNGDGDCVRIDNEPAFDITAQITIAAWVNIKTVPQEWTGIVTKGDSAWRLSTEYSQNAFHFGVAAEDYLNGSTQVGAGQWHHVACVYNGQKMSTYVDGRLDASRPRSGPLGLNDVPVAIGENLELLGRSWNGLIDDVRVYNYALTESRIKALAAGEQER